MHLIGLDIGTTGCKALLVDPASGVVARAFREYGIDSDSQGKAEQDAGQVWELSCAVLREALAAGGNPPVKALSLSVQGDAVIPVDAAGRALYPALLGMDYRSQALLPDCAERFDGFDLFRRTGMRPHPINAFLKMLWLQRERREVFAAADRIVTYSDYVMGRLGCPGVMDQCTASRTMAYSLEKNDWDDGILAAFDFPREKLSRVIPSGSRAGVMDPALARQLGFAEPPVIVAGGHDQPVAALGAGAVTSEVAVASTGTAEVLSRYLPQPVLSRGMYDSYYPCYCSAMGKGYFTFALNHVGGLALRWFRDAWCDGEVRAAAESGRDPYDVIVDAMPEGPTDIFVLPHFTGSGTPTCDLASRAAFVGMSLSTDRPTVGLALLEGLTFELKINLEQMRSLGMTTNRLRNVGGGSRSRRWLQLKADILDLPVDVMANADAACIGAAVLAGHGSGVYSSVEEGVKALVRTAGTYEPDPARVRRYAERFASYRKLYGALAPFYRRMA